MWEGSKRPEGGGASAWKGLAIRPNNLKFKALNLDSAREESAPEAGPLNSTQTLWHACMCARRHTTKKPKGREQGGGDGKKKEEKKVEIQTLEEGSNFKEEGYPNEILKDRNQSRPGKGVEEDCLG